MDGKETRMNSHIERLSHYTPNLQLDRHMAIVKLRIEELRTNPAAARWHRNPDGSVYREPTEISRMLEEHTSML